MKGASASATVLLLVVSCSTAFAVHWDQIGALMRSGSVNQSADVSVEPRLHFPPPPSSSKRHPLHLLSLLYFLLYIITTTDLNLCPFQMRWMKLKSRTQSLIPDLRFSLTV
jgi:hypothetical protein